MVVIDYIFIIIARKLMHLAVWLLLIYRRARYGYAFRLIRLAQPKYAKVDPEDYERLRKYEWFARKGRNCFYAQGYVLAGKAGKNRLIYMHQMVIKIPDGMVIDHINLDGMDNRSTNLRPATHSQNMRHRKKFLGAMYSKYKGVHWHKLHKKWAARITFERKQIHLGYYLSEIEAAKAYDRAAIKYHGEFTCLNFPD